MSQVWRKIVQHSEQTTGKGFVLRFDRLECGHSRRCNMGTATAAIGERGHVRRLCGKCEPEAKPQRETHFGAATRWNGQDMRNALDRLGDEAEPR